MPRRTLAALGLASATLLAAGPAPAQDGARFPDQRPAAITLENIGGVIVQTVEFEGEESQSYTNAGLFTSYFPFITPQQKLGFHYFVAPPLSVGLGFHYSDNDEIGETLLIAPRIGAGFSMSDGVALWLRGGVSYFSADIGSFFGELSDVWIGGEALVVLHPVDHFGFMIGPLVEFGVAGERESGGFLGGQSTTEDYEFRQLGVTFGVLADF